MIKSGHLRRLLALAILLSMAFFALGARLVDLQVLKHDKYEKIKTANTIRSYLREPRRGDILDINGNPLATSVPFKRVLADPSLIGDYYTNIALAVAPLLNYDPAQLTQLLRPTTFTNRQGEVRIRSYVDLHRKVSLENWLQVTQTLARLSFGIDESKLTRSKKMFYRQLRQSCLYAKDTQVRYYPNKNLAAHVLGYTLEHEKRFSDVIVYDMLGEYGIEKTLDARLAGTRGWRVTENDRFQHEVPVYREQDLEARPGLNAVLTIDMVIQNMVEVELAEAMKKYKPISIVAVATRPATGEILAMATLPNFDPNRPVRSTNEMDLLRNRAIADMVEPGSTFKVVAISAGLNEHLITLADKFDCEHGKWLYAGKWLHDTHGGHGVLPVEEVVAKSSNIGTAKVAIYKLGQENLYKYIRAYGFGTRTGIPLLGELPGWVKPLPLWSKDKVLISRIPIGQSITVTPLQMAMAYGAIANGGRLMRPMLVNRLQDAAGQTVVRYEPLMVRQVISEATSKEMITAMKKVVSKEGTANKAAMDHYNVAGKTGTAWKTEEGQYVHGKYVASFIGFFPADAPEVCLAIVMDEPDPKVAYYGGQTAAPIFKNIAEQIARYLQLRPDKDVPGTETLAAASATAPARTMAFHRN